jgi:hypothetical protein
MSLGRPGRNGSGLAERERPEWPVRSYEYMQSKSQGWVPLRQAVVMLAGALWLACDGESTSTPGSVGPGPAAPESPGANPGSRDAGANDAEDPGGNLGPSGGPGDESSGGGGSSSAPGRIDAGAPEAEAPGAGLADAGGLPPSNDCCTESTLPGCSNVPVLECVCAGDAACCNESYDALCVTEAITRCALACEVPPPDSDCSTPSEVPSCTVPDIAQCVCAIDPFCCTFRFDANCVVLAAAECIGAEPPGEGAQP